MRGQPCRPLSTHSNFSRHGGAGTQLSKILFKLDVTCDDLKGRRDNYRLFFFSPPSEVRGARREASSALSGTDVDCESGTRTRN
jgi:hypothetical protein